MRFFRSDSSTPTSHRKSKAHHRFSFRQIFESESHHDDDHDVTKPTPRKHSAPSFISTASTSVSSSISSPTALERTSSGSTTTSTTITTAKRTSGSRASTEEDDDEIELRTPPSSMHSDTTTTSHHHHTTTTSTTRSSSHGSFSSNRTSTGSVGSTSSLSSSMMPPPPRHSLAGYRQLHCSMSYKNRMSILDEPSGMSHHGSGAASSRRSETGSRSSSGASSFSLSSSFLRDSSSHSLSATMLASTMAEPSTPAAAPTAASTIAAPTPEEAALAGRMTEASVAALQTRRAFQQMVLAIEDEESSDYDSESESGVRYSSVRHSTDSSSTSSGGIVQLGADEYRKFQFRLRQLEDLCHEQARKQANMEETIEQEVEARTKKVVDAMEKKIAMYKQAKDLECEREIQRRVNEAVARHSTASSTSSRDSGQLPPQYPTTDGKIKGKPLDKILHPRRTRKRMEMMREREEQQRREMDQFREFIRNTEMRCSKVDAALTPATSSSNARASIIELADPHITEDLFNASQNELIEMICVLRKHVSVQEDQLDEAKRLICSAMEAREEAEATAREAVELTMHLDSRLERASQEMIELRRSSEYSMRSSASLSFLANKDPMMSSFRSSASRDTERSIAPETLP